MLSCLPDETPLPLDHRRSLRSLQNVCIPQSCWSTVTYNFLISLLAVNIFFIRNILILNSHVLVLYSHIKLRQVYVTNLVSPVSWIPAFKESTIWSSQTYQVLQHTLNNKWHKFSHTCLIPFHTFHFHFTLSRIVHTELHLISPSFTSTKFFMSLLLVPTRRWRNFGYIIQRWFHFRIVY